MTPPNLMNLLLPKNEQVRRAESSEAHPAIARKVWLAQGGREAIGLFMRHGDAIDVVLLDVHMPDMDGPRTLAALRKLNPRVRCCFMSADTGAFTDENLRGMSDAALLRKPFRLTEIPLMLWELTAPLDREEPFPTYPGATTAARVEAPISRR